MLEVILFREFMYALHLGRAETRENKGIKNENKNTNINELS